ncbi:MAG TPA: hypothetical protein VL021_10265 [Brumimicrobium sp.]|nr:hypothetical protein [Brumimicrobium sp.]
MEEFHTIKTFNHSIEMGMVKSRLMAEEIPFRVLDELTIDVDPLFSPAIGGVKLQVQKKDYERVAEILAEEGFPVQTYIPPSKLYVFFDKHSASLPLIGHLRIEWRAMIIVGLLTLLMAGLILLFTTPPVKERLNANTWCIDKIVHNDKEYKPKTNSIIKITGPGVCQEKIMFDDYRKVYLPGFDTELIEGTWDYFQDSLFIFNVEEFSGIYNGAYKLKFKKGRLIMKSKRTTIYCSLAPMMSYPRMVIEE